MLTSNRFATSRIPLLEGTGRKGRVNGSHALGEREKGSVARPGRADAETAKSVDDGSKRPGRPPSADAHRAIIDATLDLLAEERYGSLTMEGVAARAGVAKSTIYRRWPSKMALAVAAWEAVAAEVKVPDTGTIRGDLVRLLEDIIRVITRTVARRIIPGLVAEAEEDPELEEAFRAFWASRRAIMIRMLERGVSRGELPADTDFELTADLLYGPIYYRFLISGAPLPRTTAGRIVDAVFGSSRTSDPP
jgi:AcrR family transcriptional regulator